MVIDGRTRKIDMPILLYELRSARKTKRRLRALTVQQFSTDMMQYFWTLGYESGVRSSFGQICSTQSRSLHRNVSFPNHDNFKNDSPNELRRLNLARERALAHFE